MSKARPISATAAALCLGLLAAACSPSGPAKTEDRGNPPPSTASQGPLPAGYMARQLTPTAPLTAQQYWTAVDDIAARAARAKATAASPARADVARRTIELLAGTPRMADNGIGPDGSVWVRLVDGTPVVVILNREPMRPGEQNPLMVKKAPQAAAIGRVPQVEARLADGFGDARIVLASAQSPTRAAGGPPKTYAFPKSERAWVAVADNLAPNASIEIQRMLTKQGYQVFTDSSTETFRDGVKDVGVLWLSTHGAPYPDVDGRTRFGIVTGEDITGGKCLLAPAKCAATQADIDARRAFAGILSSVNRGFVMINDDWIRKYWTLSQDSLVFIDACLVFGGGPASDFVRALQRAPGTNGRITLLGWSGLVNKYFAEEAATWFFSRVLGDDQYQPPSPPQRPFSAPEVWRSMAALQKIEDPNNAASVLLFTQNGPDASILAPSIRNMTVSESTKELHVHGEFGAVDGTVEIEAAPMTVQWGHNKLVVTIPDTGQGSKGAVIAKFRGRQISNETPLTDWHAKVRLRHTHNAMFGAPGPYYELNCADVHFRADIHPFRMEPEQSAVAGTTYGDRYDQDIPIENIAADSTCAGTGTGSGFKTTGASTIQISFVLPRRPLQWADQRNTPSDNWFFGLGRLNPVTKRLVLGTSSLAMQRNGLKLQPVRPNPRPPAFQNFGFSSALANDAVLKRPQQMNGLFNVPRHIERFKLMLGTLEDKGEYEVEVTADPGTRPTATTPG